MKRPLLVTDPFLATQPMTQKALEEPEGRRARRGDVLRQSSRTRWRRNVYAGLEALKAGGHDGVVAFGGGSALDAGKVIAFMAGQTRPMWDFEDVGDWWTRADPAGIAPVIAVPTTAGTGSEVGRAGVITQEATHTKKVIFHPGMMPKVDDLRSGAHRRHAAQDHGRHRHGCAGALPRGLLLRRSITRWPTASPSRACASSRRTCRAPTATARTSRRAAHMMSAAAMGATAFQKGLGAIHALSHPVGALYDTHHGLTNAVFMPYVLVYNRAAIEPKIERLAAYLGLKPSFTAFLDWMLALREALGVPHTLAGLGVDDAKFDLMSTMAPEDPTAGGNPVPLDKASARKLFEQALAGTL